ncbi:hypothetical protein [Actinoplanes sp. NBRC 101535]|uniref:hypothetical protein n=1 Tax=Actinoplanes sp. NBRC 101535 TaxID=3032196 RepID=UPI0024A4957A|nr:hypothetical protein [Actinoplanes sp. NBRC 101535]GLY08300.1 hypothetical protein Acsp01_86790 [Actinoplanes sp. NBRC 101535]
MTSAAGGQGYLVTRHTDYADFDDVVVTRRLAKAGYSDGQIADPATSERLNADDHQLRGP